MLCRHSHCDEPSHAVLAAPELQRAANERGSPAHGSPPAQSRNIARHGLAVESTKAGQTQERHTLERQDSAASCHWPGISLGTEWVHPRLWHL